MSRYGMWVAACSCRRAHHFQSADALCAVDLPAAAGGGILAATFDAHGVAAWLLPPAAAMQTQGLGQVGGWAWLLVAARVTTSTFQPAQPPGAVDCSCLHVSAKMSVFPPLRLQPAAVRLGGFQAPRDIFSMALSPDGRFIATGGEAGVLAIYSVHPGAPLRCWAGLPA